MTQREEDRRRHPRFQCSGNAEMRSLSSGIRAVGKIENLSLGGCRIQVGDRHTFREGENVEMTFTVRQLPLRVQASIRQLHSSDAVGVAFTLLSERGRSQLQALIEELGEILRDQVESLIQYQSSVVAFPAAPPSSHPSPTVGPSQKEPPGFGTGPVPINRRPS